MTHGGNIRALREKSGVQKIIDFSASINPVGAPEWLRREVSRALDEASFYPDVECRDLIEAVVEAFNVDAGNVITCNGTSEVLFALPRIGEFKKAYLPAPAYIDYQRACRNAGVEVVEFGLSDGRGGFAYPEPAKLAAMVEPGSVVFICSPLNPCGISVAPAYFKELAGLCPDSLVVADAAYWDFLHGVDYAGRGWVGEMPENVIVLWSMTKFYSMPGLRLGLSFGCGELFYKIKNYLPPWNVGTLSQYVGTRALRDIEFAEYTQTQTADIYQRFYDGLASIDGLRPNKSAANFIFCELVTDKFSAGQLRDRLLEKGLAVRACGDFSGLSGEWLRMAVRCDEDNNKLLAAFEEILNPASLKKNVQKKKTPALMLLGTCSNAGKSVLTAALCRILKQDGIKVAPFKAQNMALNSYVCPGGGEIGNAQALQAQAAGVVADVRMNPVLLKPCSDVGSQVVVNGEVVGNMKVNEYVAYKEKAFAVVKDSYDSLAAEYDAVILEGAGSPAEINLKSHDIVNLRMAEYAGAGALLIGDIDRGGVYASFIGSYETMQPRERELIKGFLVNRFRGDESLLAAAHEYVKEFTGKDVLGVVPYIKNINLPEEDSVSFREHFSPRGGKDKDSLDIAVICIPALANYTDLDPFLNEPDVRLRLVYCSGEFGRPDAVILAGSKNVLGDLAFLRESGLYERIREYAEDGGSVAGICGGLQLMGENIADPHNIEGGGSGKGLGLFNTSTVFEEPKILVRKTAVHKLTGKAVAGFEMHNGRTDFTGQRELFVTDSGEVLGIGDERIFATYLHGVFSADDYRRSFIDSLRVKKGLQPLGRVVAEYSFEPALDKLAEIVRKNIDIKMIYEILGV